MAEEFQECSVALQTAEALVGNMDDMRIKFCRGEMRFEYICVCSAGPTLLTMFHSYLDDAALSCEKRKDYAAAMEVYMNCLNDCNAVTSMGTSDNTSADAHALPFMRELRGEIMLRIAVVKKDLGAVDQAMIMCNNILAEHCCESVRANTLCLKVCLLLQSSRLPVDCT